MKHSMKSELQADSVFTRNSKLSSHSMLDGNKRNQDKFKKYVNEKG